MAQHKSKSDVEITQRIVDRQNLAITKAQRAQRLIWDAQREYDRCEELRRKRGMDSGGNFYDYLT